MPIQHNIFCYLVLYGITWGSCGQKIRILMLLNQMTNFIEIQTIAHEFGGDKFGVNFIEYTDRRI